MKHLNWFDGVKTCQDRGIGYVIITVMGSMGSTPRPQGTKMVVSPEQVFGTIGGGNLEYQSIQSARAMLLEDTNCQKLEHFPLAAKLSQCCGGSTHILFESFVQHKNAIALFGAGHVAKALVPILCQLPLQIDWFDTRERIFDDIPPLGNVKQHIIENAGDAFSKIPETKFVLVMTHDHQIDFDIVEQGLQRGHIDYIGLIGSITKAKRFKYRLNKNKKAAANLSKLVSPVGVLSIPGKSPIEVAVSIAGQVIQRLNENKTPSSQQLKNSWQQTKQIADVL